MELLSWTEAPEEIDGVTLPYEMYMRSTPTNRGIVIDPMRGNYMSETEISSRRYSVARRFGSTESPLWIFQIVSIAYDDGFDSEDPIEPFRKIITAKYAALMEASTTAYSLKDWDGSSQRLAALGLV